MNQVQKVKSQIVRSVSENEQVDPFGVNVYASLSYKKIERIVVALQLVTNKLDAADSTRKALRELCVTLLKDTLALRDGFQSTSSAAVDTIVSHMRLVLSLVDVLHVSGSLSENNARVIKGACARFVVFLNNAETARFAESLELTDEYFGGSDQERVALEKSVLTESKNTHQSSAITAMSESAPQVAQATTQPQQKNGPRKPAATPHNLPESADRRGGILAVIDARGKATVKDIGAVVTGCSEKTIQRELNAMIAEGQLRKVGERRWTTYFKA